MKKLLFLITLALFCAGAFTQSFAAPAQNRTAKKATTKKATKATARKATANAGQKTKAQERREVQNQQFGLMPSDIDNANHNVFHADANAIKGARDTESALRYLPFVTIVNTAGFGSSFDLRGQGRLSTNGVRLFLNGVPATPTDSYFNPMPINTVIPSLIQEVSVQPGGGAVLYGSGAKGGTINIVTSQRSAPVYIVGAGYLNTMASTGNSFNAYAQAAENIGPHLKVNAGLAGQILGGPRTDDKLTNAQAIAGAWYDIGWGQSVSVDADVFYAKQDTTPYNSLLDFDNINNFMLTEVSLPMDSLSGKTGAGNPFEENRYKCLAGNTTACLYPIGDYEPSKDDRETPGYGSIVSKTTRATARVDYTSRLTERLKLGVVGFGNFQQTKYDEYLMNLPFFVLGYVNPSNPTGGLVDGKMTHYNIGYNWFLPRPTNPTHPHYIPGEGVKFTGANGDNQRADWHVFDQSGTKYSDYKIGGKARVDWQHDNGLFIAGVDFDYEMSKKDSKSYLRQAIVDGSAMAGLSDFNGNGEDTARKYSSNQFTSLQAEIFDKSDINVLTTAAYVYDRYDFNRNLSLGFGARYELKNYDIKITDNFEGKKLAFGNLSAGTRADGSTYIPDDDYVDYDNSNYNANAEHGKNQVINGVLQTTDREGNVNPDGVATSEAKGEYSKNYDNFIFELAPVYRYSNTGAIYARAELGYKAPPAWAMLRRIGIVWGASSPRDTWLSMVVQQAGGGTSQVVTGASPYGNVLEFDFGFQQTDLKNETYYTAELGWKELIGTRRVPLFVTNLDINALLFSANVFYTASQNEFYFEGDTWSGIAYGNYSKSRRMGAEVALEQYIFDGMLGFNESLTYLKAQKMDCSHFEPLSKDALTGMCKIGEEWQTMPYTYDYKATFGAKVNISTFVEVVDVSVDVWLQNSLYGNQYIPITNVGLTPLVNNQSYNFYTNDGGYEKLKPYLISDFGVSVGINKNMGVVTVGIKNLFDTFYYDYYNNDKSAVVNENRYIIGRGRTVFIEGQFKY